jgi:hypothetical protein
MGRSWLIKSLHRSGRFNFFLKFFLEFFVPREVGGTDDFNFEFGFTELETAGDIGPVGRDDLEGMQGSTARAM